MFWFRPEETVFGRALNIIATVFGNLNMYIIVLCSGKNVVSTPYKIVLFLINRIYIADKFFKIKLLNLKYNFEPISS